LDKGENVFIITGDRDMLQILGLNDNGTWTIALDPVVERKKISLTKEVLQFKDTNSSAGDIFEFDDPLALHGSANISAIPKVSLQIVIYV
jgi:5'-3' exonuclease